MRKTPIFSDDEKRVLLVSVEIGWFVLASLGRYIKNGEVGLDGIRNASQEVRVGVEQIINGESK